MGEPILVVPRKPCATCESTIAERDAQIEQLRHELKREQALTEKLHMRIATEDPL